MGQERYPGSHTSWAPTACGSRASRTPTSTSRWIPRRVGPSPAVLDRPYLRQLPDGGRGRRAREGDVRHQLRASGRGQEEIRPPQPVPQEPQLPAAGGEPGFLNGAAILERGFPSPADVAQLVEHFTRNEGVLGSSPSVGFSFQAIVHFPKPCPKPVWQVLCQVGGLTDVRSVEWLRSPIPRRAATRRARAEPA